MFSLQFAHNTLTPYSKETIEKESFNTNSVEHTTLLHNQHQQQDKRTTHRPIIVHTLHKYIPHTSNLAKTKTRPTKGREICPIKDKPPLNSSDQTLFFYFEHTHPSSSLSHPTSSSRTTPWNTSVVMIFYPFFPHLADIFFCELIFIRLQFCCSLFLLSLLLATAPSRREPHDSSIQQQYDPQNTYDPQQTHTIHKYMQITTK